MPAKKLLIMSVSAGMGHVRAAEAIRACALQHPDVAEVLHLDAMDFVTAGFRKVYTDFYVKLVDKAPTLWGYLYNHTHEAKADSSLERLRRALERMNARALRRQIRALRPDAIICTHFLPAEMLARQIHLGELDCPVWVQVTDFDLHRLWVHEGMAGYFAANDEVAFRMQAQGICARHIEVTGIPIMPAFGQPLNRSVCAAEYGLDPTQPTLLLMGGGAGVGSLETIAQRLMRLGQRFQLLVLAGRNQQVLASLQALALEHPGRLFPQGFTGVVERLMVCADLVITKPGGLTTSECMAMGLPMIVNSPIPGQEERNADYLLEQGVALKAFDGVTLEYRVRRLLDQPALLATMRERSRALGRPDAAQRVLTRVLS